jgi:hypothetical protein
VQSVILPSFSFAASMPSPPSPPHLLLFFLCHVLRTAATFMPTTIADAIHRRCLDGSLIWSICPDCADGWTSSPPTRPHTYSSLSLSSRRPGSSLPGNTTFFSFSAFQLCLFLLVVQPSGFWGLPCVYVCVCSFFHFLLHVDRSWIYRCCCAVVAKATKRNVGDSPSSFTTPPPVFAFFFFFVSPT